MGCGKTTIGRRLAAIMQKEFVDIDQKLEERTGVTVSHIFKIEGEEGFRSREKEMLGEIAENEAQVVATGGGIVLKAENRKQMKNTGCVIFLDAPLEVLWERICRCKNRPLLQTIDPKATLKQLMLERKPVYEETADLIIPIGQGRAEQAAEKIHSQLHLCEK